MLSVHEDSICVLMTWRARCARPCPSRSSRPAMIDATRDSLSCAFRTPMAASVSGFTRRSALPPLRSARRSSARTSSSQRRKLNMKAKSSHHIILSSA